MAPYRRRKIGASRRRREDEGEDEGSIAGELEDDSLSDGSVVSNQDDDADGEGSEASEDDSSVSPRADRPNGYVNGVHEGGAEKGRSPSPGKRLLASTLSDTEAMMNGMKISDADQVAEIRFEDMKEEQEDKDDNQTGRTPSAAESKRETFAERKRREHEEYIKARDENPAFVPTRGGFFLHDKRSTEPDTNSHRPFNNRSKSRPHGLIVDGNVGRRPPKQPDASEGQWTHDLHETVARDERPASKSPLPPPHTTAPSNASRPVPTAPRSSPPNRSFSSTVLIGNVPVVVFLPGMANPVSFAAVPKRQHTRLPQHRPPLRRDKPVRISLPGQPPRYIFPATERSFIFIPRALRPNQQGFRGRGRGGFYGSRRPGLYPGSGYTGSVPMSRRSSLGRVTSQEGVHSPAGSVLSRQTMTVAENGKPIVRLPPPARPPGQAYQPPTTTVGASTAPGGPGVPPPPASYPQAPPSTTFRESRPAPIPMHQPRPQKAVSVADIESPASFNFNPPQPQQEHPFHQQVPVPVTGPAYAPDAAHYPHGRHPSHPSQASATPLSQIPERAIHAQPFQPYAFQQPPQGYYPAAFPPGTVFYPVSGAEYPQYSAPAGPGVPVPPFIPPGQQVPYVFPPPPPVSGDQPAQSGTVAHEAGGTVYFYDTSQLYPTPSYPAGGVVGMGGMMTPPGTTYYYPQPPGVYYATQ
ncbi:hypothetical protein VTN77DRAFT_4947 [Rasamsonia byssochlamydoides]|uniref:uncharacterized protein n=1 Tax=Rasamsonia byssochlamydoides TaxID=89139 RepID=UPI0037429DFA